MAGESSSVRFAAILTLVFGAVGALLVAPLLATGLVMSLLIVFCLPGFPAVRMLGLRCSVNPALTFGAAGVIGFLVSTLTGVAIMYLLPNACYATLFFPALLFVIWRMFQRTRSEHDDTAKLEKTTPFAHPFNRGDWIALCVIMSLVLAVVVPPLANIGKQYPEGRFYRAYFNVDYLKHVAITAHLSHAEIPPDNPYLKTEEPLHYYWFYYLFPAAVRGLNVPNVETMDILRVLTIFGVLIFCQLLYGLSRHLALNRSAALMAVFCGLFAYSYEGLFILRKVRESNDPLLHGIGKFNVDAATRWFIGHPQIDGLYRTLIFTPQHLFGLMLFCISFFCVCRWYSGSVVQPWKRLWFMGLLTGLTFGFSSFIGLIGYIWLTGVTGFLLIWRKDVRTTLHIALSLAVSIGILAVLGILYRRPESLMFLPQSEVIAKLPQFLIYNFGPLILLSPLGIIRGIRTHRFVTFNLVALLLLCMFLILYVQIQNFPTDMGIKLGLIVSVVFVFLAAIGLSASTPIPRRLLISIAVILMVPAIPTLLMDIFNSSDATNARYSTFVEQEDIDACQWIRDNLPVESRIQSDPYERYEAFSLIPTFAERRTTAGDKMHARIFLSDPDVFDALDQAVGRLYRQTDPVQAAGIMRDLDIDFLFAGRTEREKYPGIDALIGHFVTPYRQDGVVVASSELIATLRVESDSPEVIDGMISTKVMLTSADPVLSHRLTIVTHLVDSNGKNIAVSEHTGVELSPLENRSVSLQFPIPENLPPDIFSLHIDLHHIFDDSDVFLQTDYRFSQASTVIMPLKTPVPASDFGVEKPLESEASLFAVARFDAGVLPAGNYCLSISEMATASGGVLRVLKGAHNASVTPIATMKSLSEIPAAESSDQAQTFYFELQNSSSVTLEAIFTENAVPPGIRLRLTWVANQFYPHALSRVSLPYTHLL